MNEIIDLWPELKKENIRSPKSILREQAELLGKKTNNILLGEVALSNPVPISYDQHEHYEREKEKANDPFYKETILEKYDKEIHFVFKVKAVLLGGYSYTIFSGRYRVAELYPAYIEDEAGMNEEQFVNLIRKILNNSETKKIINSLYAQSLEEVK